MNGGDEFDLLIYRSYSVLREDFDTFISGCGTIHDWHINADHKEPQNVPTA